MMEMILLAESSCIDQVEGFFKGKEDMGRKKVWEVGWNLGVGVSIDGHMNLSPHWSGSKESGWIDQKVFLNQTHLMHPC